MQNEKSALQLGLSYQRKVYQVQSVENNEKMETDVIFPTGSGKTHVMFFAVCCEDQVRFV